MTTDISVYGNYLTLAPEDGAEYKLEAQWPVEQKYQWRKFLENLELLPKIEKLRNPVVEKDPEVIIFVQNNPDQISGEDIYLSADSNILRISRLAVDTLYLDKNKNFYKFLKMQADKNDAAYSKSENDKTKEEEAENIPLNKLGLVVIFRGGATLTSPIWHISDPQTIDDYLKMYETVKNNSDPQDMGPLPRSKQGDKNRDLRSFDTLNTFMIYTNYPGAKSRLISVNEYGYVRSTRIQLNAVEYTDNKNFFRTFLFQAKDAKQMLIESEKKRNLKLQQHDF
ncbi:MAG: hypothetical protein KDJ26_05800 [Alphaproteobacteria bacterium]|nr:hypothetical protein [Alphaproteobacteria bacterium]MCB1551497.1 hypothetical protein [Alphaproteobacteria bacterium]MCB9985064.1 hypothetical protein [Micavibrio sp.]HRK97446.1 hypothetical protein [Alphaproteobacteria bacterium]